MGADQSILIDHTVDDPFFNPNHRQALEHQRFAQKLNERRDDLKLASEARKRGLDAQKILAKPNFVFIEILEETLVTDSAELSSLQEKIDAEVCACKTWVLVYDEQKQDEAAKNGTDKARKYQAPVMPLPGQVGSLRICRESAATKVEAFKYRNIVGENHKTVMPSLKEARKTLKEAKSDAKCKSSVSSDSAKAMEVQKIQTQLAQLGMI